MRVLARASAVAVSTASLAAAVHAAAGVPALPPDPDTGFFVRYRVDGRQVQQKLYGFRHSAFAILAPSDTAPGDANARTLRLEFRSNSEDAVQEGLALYVQDRFRLDDQRAQSFPLTGPAFCVPAAEQPDDPGSRAEYAVARTGVAPRSWGHFRLGSPLYEGTLDEDRANRDPLGHHTGARGLTGVFEGELTVTKIDRVNQVLEGRFRFDAGRQITTRRLPTGEFDGRCWEAGDFAVGRVSVSEGEFRVRYCVDPVHKGNDRQCPDGLSSDVLR